MQPKIIRRVKVADLSEWGRNPRKIDIKKFEELKKRILERGFNDVLKVAFDGVTVIGGNHRLRALKDLGINEIDILITGDKTDEDMLKTALSDNQEFAEYDVKALRLQLSEMPGLDLTGYEINLGGGRPVIDVVGVTEDDDVEDDFDLENSMSEESDPISQRGVVYQLGEHRVMCGDSTSNIDLATLLAAEKAQLVFTDPPYMVDYHSSSKSKKFSSANFGGDGSNIANDNLSNDDALLFYTDVLDNLYNHTTDDAAIYWWFASTKHRLNSEAFEATSWYHSQNIMWIKEQFIFSMGQDFHRMHEPAMFGWKKGNKHFKARKINNMSDTFTDADNFKCLIDTWIETRDRQKDYIHPTQKPVALSVRAIRYHSLPGDIVIDLFGGSGSTLMGAERLSRRARLMELDPKFVDAIRKRWARFMNGDTCDWQALTPPINGGHDGE